MGDNFKLEMIFGSVEIQTRIIPQGDAVLYQARSVHRDERGILEKETEWETNSKMYWEQR